MADVVSKRHYVFCDILTIMNGLLNQILRIFFREDVWRIYRKGSLTYRADACTRLRRVLRNVV